MEIHINNKQVFLMITYWFGFLIVPTYPIYSSSILTDVPSRVDVSGPENKNSESREPDRETSIVDH